MTSKNDDIQLQAQANSLHRLDTSMAELNARIARLAIVLGVCLDREDDVRRVLTHRPDPHPLHAAQGPEFQKREHEHVLIELRGLLVMRYGIERHIVEDQGASVTRRVLEQAQSELTKHGFKPGADGLDLNQLFKHL
jgi:hypothetical protein